MAEALASIFITSWEILGNDCLAKPLPNSLLVDVGDHGRKDYLEAPGTDSTYLNKPKVIPRSKKDWRD